MLVEGLEWDLGEGEFITLGLDGEEEEEGVEEFLVCTGKEEAVGMGKFASFCISNYISTCFGKFEINCCIHVLMSC